MRRQSLVVTEHLIVLACERCGRSTTGADADVVREETVLLYRCPNDGAILARVEGSTDASSAASFDEGRLAIKLGGEEIVWADLLLSIEELDD
jgi:hypothetical protein